MLPCSINTSERSGDSRVSLLLIYADIREQPVVDMWKSEDSLEELILSFHHMGPVVTKRVNAFGGEAGEGCG